MLQDYILKALKLAKYEVLTEDGYIFGEIPDCQGVYARAESFEECRRMLIEILEEWLIFRLRRNLEIPVIENVDLNILISADADN